MAHQFLSLLYIPKYIYFFVIYNYRPVRKRNILIYCHICFQVRPCDAEVIAKRLIADSALLYNNQMYNEYTIAVASNLCLTETCLCMSKNWPEFGLLGSELA
jgi:hypothetical protein